MGKKKAQYLCLRKDDASHLSFSSCMCVANKLIFISEDEMFITLLELEAGFLVCIPEASCWTFPLLNM